MTRPTTYFGFSLLRTVLAARARGRARALGLAGGRMFRRRKPTRPTPDYRLMVEKANEGVWLIDAESRTTFVNPRMAELLGYPAEELAGRSMFDFMDEEWKARARRNVERRQHHVTETHEFKFLRKDGSVLWALVAATPLFEGGRYAGALAMVSDIGELKRAEWVLRDREERYRMLFETSVDALLVTDENTRFVEANPQACALTGYAREELLGMTLADLTAPELPDRGAGTFAELERKGSLRGEYPILRKDGRVVPAEFTATRVGAHRFQGSLRDVSEQKRERAQRDRLLHQVQLDAAELDATISAIPAGVVILDAAGRLVRTNAAARSMLRGQLDDVAIAGGPLASSRRDALAGEVVTGRVVEIEPGSEVPISVSVAVAPIREEGEGGVVGAVMILTDITTERKLQRQQEEQLHTISHDLRVPLSVMMVQARLVERLSRSRDDAQLSRLSGSIVNAGRQLNGLIQDLVESTRIDSGQLVLELGEFDPSSFLRGLLARLEGVLDIGRIRLELPSSPTFAFGDTARLERVVVNLLTNALKYSEPGSEVVLRADTLGGHLVVSVSDSGPGISAEEVPSLFSRFRRAGGARARGEGLGLGLYICKRLVEAHRGRIWVRSEVGRGTTVTFEIPAAAAVAEAAPREGAS